VDLADHFHKINWCSLLGVLMAALEDGTLALLIFIPIAFLTWAFRPKDWRAAFSGSDASRVPAKVSPVVREPLAIDSRAGLL
jgi:hypothetical protein